MPTRHIPGISAIASLGAQTGTLQVNGKTILPSTDTHEGGLWLTLLEPTTLAPVSSEFFATATSPDATEKLAMIILELGVADEPQIVIIQSSKDFRGCVTSYLLHALSSLGALFEQQDLLLHDEADSIDNVSLVLIGRFGLPRGHAAQSLTQDGTAASMQLFQFDQETLKNSMRIVGCVQEKNLVATAHILPVSEKVDSDIGLNTDS